MNPRILIVEDDTQLLIKLEGALEIAGYEVASACSCADGMNSLKDSFFDVIVTETRLPDCQDLNILKEFRRKSDATIIVITSRGTIKEAVEAVELGALDYIIKPFLLDEFLITIDRAFDYKRLQQENIRLRKDITEYFNRPNIIGESEAMKMVFALIDKVSVSDSTVLILGESGTGKELVASTIHYQSGRKDRPLVKLNCAALPQGLVESELFGHEKGAFTGALKRKPGRFELANKGTIFLDEIADLPLTTQAKLLRVLQEKSFERVGGIELVSVDVRVIAATNRPLADEVKAGNFREDLFFRLNVIPITVPPLRERKVDILPLVEHFLGKIEKKTSRLVRFSKDAMDALTKYDYPGNVRELENIIERSATLSATHIIKKSELPKYVLKKSRTEVLLPLADVLRNTEKEYIVSVLEFTRWNKSRAAEILGISRKNLWEKIKTRTIQNKP